MTTTARLALPVLLLALLAPPTADAQAALTGNLRGTVRDAGGGVLPGVTVTATSAALQGMRTAVSGVNGDYALRHLPPGDYRLVFELEGMTRVVAAATVELGRTGRRDAILQLAAIEESMVVTAAPAAALETLAGGANYSVETVDALPVGRSLSEIAELAPGLTANAPNAELGQLTISGGFAYDNLFLVDGVDVADNLFGAPSDSVTGDTALFIEEAIQETQILTSAISAEYGRFTGGVVNALTRSGGNQLQGSLRLDLSNPRWRDETPLEDELGSRRRSRLSEVLSATLGGPLVRDRLWFFAAGRDTETSDPSVFRLTGAPRPDELYNQRFEIKLTGSFAGRHSWQTTYTANETSVTAPVLEIAVDPRTIDRGSVPSDLFAIRYAGIVSDRALVEGRYSEKHLRFGGFGGVSRELRDSPFLTLTQEPAHYNAPYFDAGDPEERDNRQLAVSFAYLLVSRNAGTHDLKIGGEHFASIVRGGNSQSASEHVFGADLLTDAGGDPRYDDAGRLMPVFLPGLTLAAHYVPLRGARSEIETAALYVNDSWSLGDRWSLNLGFRWEEVRGRSTGGIRQVASDSLVPRLGMSWDPRGDGRYRLGASWGEYSGRHAETLFNAVTHRFPDLFLDLYLGPPGAGLDFGPGFDPGNYLTVFAQTKDNVANAEGLSAPVAEELTFSVGRRLGDRGHLEAIYVERSLRDVIEDSITLADGRSVVELPLGPQEVDNIVYRNSGLPSREYRAIQLDGRYRVDDAWQLQGHWTWQLRNHGNFEGESLNAPGTVSLIDDYPEIYVAERNFPDGRLDDFQRHKVRLWATWERDLGAAGRVGLGLLYRFDSARTYSLVAGAVPVTAIQAARDPGYATAPFSQPVFFGRRGAGEFADRHVVDLAVDWTIERWPPFEPWIKVEVRNLLNERRQIAWDVTVFPDPAGAVDADGLPLAFVPGPDFGEARTPRDFVTPRELRLSLGLRF